MTLQSENGAPSFYTFATFRPGRTALVYGGVLSILAFCAVAFVFNYGIKEKLWSFEGAPYGFISPAASESPKISTPTSAQADKIVRVALPDRVLRSLTGTYFSTTANRKYLVTFDGGQLSLQIDRGNRIELIPISDDTLYAGQGHLIKFAATPAGTIDQLDLYDNGRHIVAARQ